MEEKVYFPRRGFRSRRRPGTPRFRTVLLVSRNQRSIVQNFSSLGAIAAKKYATDGQTDRRHNDFSRAHFSKMCSKNCFLFDF
jgi:hypothetical protein